jgi:DHA1 family tetracycline resistance protein-like MFS transporter
MALLHRRRAARRPLPPGFGTIWSTVALDLVGFGIILPILAIYGERLGASPTTLGFLVSSFSVAQLVCSPLLGRLSDRIGRRPVILLSLFGTAVGSVITGGATSVWMLFVGRIVDGASGASVSVAQGAVTDVAPPEERAHLLGLLSAAFGVGFVLGPALGGLSALAGPRVPFFVAAAIAFVNGLIAIKRLPETHPPSARRRVAAAVAEPVVEAGERRRALVRLALVAFIATAAFSAFEATFSLFGQRRFDLTEGSVSVVFVGIGVLLVAVQGGMVRPVNARFGSVVALRVALGLTAIGLLLLAASTTWLLLVPALALLVVGQGLATPTMATLVADRAHDARRGGALGFQQSAGALARIVGPAMGGILFEHVGVAAPYVVGAAMVGVALLLATGLQAPSRPGWQPRLPAGNLTPWESSR